MKDIDHLSKAAREAQKILEHNSQTLELAWKAANSSTIQIFKTIEENSAVRRMLEDVEHHKARVNTAEGPLAELRKAGVFDSKLPFQHELQDTQRMMSEYKARFRLPVLGASAQLVEQLQQSSTADVLARYSEHPSTLQRAMEAMQTPWLDSQEPLRSVRGFAELQGIAGILARLPTFDEQVTKALRIDLGDWRDRITWTDQLSTDLTVRHEFYIDLGFDSALTDFPAPAFQDGMVIAGLRGEPPIFVDAYSAPFPQPSREEDEKALVRTNKAHDTLLRLETQIRKFIDDQMTSAFGKDWPKHRLPKDLYENWQQKR